MRKLQTRTEASTPSAASKEFTSSHPLERSNDIYEDLSSEGEEALEHPLASVKDIRRRKSTHFQEVTKEEYIEPWNAWSALPYQDSSFSVAPKVFFVCYVFSSSRYQKKDTNQAVFP